jgi:RNA polymerase sigma factor (sigma-70 family)
VSNTNDVLGGVVSNTNDEVPVADHPGSERDDAVAELFGRRRGPMARLAYVLTRDSEVSDEIVQEAFLRLHAVWDRVDYPSAYLRTAVVNACHSHHRHLEVVRRTPLEGVATVSHDDSDGELAMALEKLPYAQRAVLVLPYFGDLHDADIAATLSIRRATVRSRASRAIQQLRKEITR